MPAMLPYHDMRELDETFLMVDWWGHSPYLQSRSWYCNDSSLYVY